MPLADFVHLRVHTAYSLSAGAIRTKELVELCKAERMPAVAVTDTGNLFGALEVATTCAAAGVQPIIGCEIALERNGASEGSLPTRGLSEPDRIVLLTQNEAGYRNLLDLVSRSYLAGEVPTEPGITHSDLAAAGEGLLCLTGGPRGPVGRLLAEGQADAAEAVLTQLAGLFPNRLYVELMRHGMPDETRTSRASSSWRIVTTCRSSRPTTPIFPIAIFTRRTTRCSALPRRPSSPIRNASG